jgi:quercetin dioxygenase-like cupin family protein
MNRSLVVMLVLAGVALSAQSNKETEITAESHHHLVLQNREVRVFQVEVAGHQTIPMHRHGYDYAYVTLGEAEISNDVQGKAPADVKLRDGETRFVPGNFAHSVRDLADTPFRNVTVEFLPSGNKQREHAPAWLDDRGLQVLEGGTQEILFVKDGVRVSDVQLNPGATLAKDRQAAAQLMVSVTAVELQTSPRTRSRALKAGDVLWLPASQPVHNSGKQAARFIVFEFPGK